MLYVGQHSHRFKFDKLLFLCFQNNLRRIKDTCRVEKGYD